MTTTLFHPTAALAAEHMDVVGVEDRKQGLQLLRFTLKILRVADQKRVELTMLGACQILFFGRSHQ